MSKSGLSQFSQLGRPSQQRHPALRLISAIQPHRQPKTNIPPTSLAHQLHLKAPPPPLPSTLPPPPPPPHPSPPPSPPPLRRFHHPPRAVPAPHCERVSLLRQSGSAAGGAFIESLPPPRAASTLSAPLRYCWVSQLHCAIARSVPPHRPSPQPLMCHSFPLQPQRRDPRLPTERARLDSSSGCTSISIFVPVSMA